METEFKDPVHIEIYNKDGQIGVAFEFDSDSWSVQLSDDEEYGSPLAHELIHAFHSGLVVIVRPGPFV